MKTEVVTFMNTSLEITYLIGENANDNFEILNKASGDDIWFHANNISSCHIIATNLQKCSKKERLIIIKRGAFLCKQNTSKIKSLQNIEIYKKDDSVVFYDEMDVYMKYVNVINQYLLFGNLIIFKLWFLYKFLLKKNI